MLSDLRLRLRSLFRRNNVESDLNAELHFHFDQQVEKFVQSGMPLAEARRRARLAIGTSDQVREQYRDASGVRFFDTLLQDIRFALRMLRKSPGFTAVAVLTLALGIGANTAIFSVINAVMLRPLPVSKPGQLVQLSQTDTRGNRYLNFTHPSFEQVHDHNHVLAGVAGFLYLPRPVTAIVGAQAELASAMLASCDYFSVLGIAAAKGRVFTNADAIPGKDRVAVLSHDYWTRRFNRDPSIIGKSVTINGTLLTIIGVAPTNFYGIEVGQSPDLTIPETMQPELISVGGQSFLNNPKVHWIEIIARLKPGVTARAAQGDLSAIFQHMHNDPTDSLRLELIPFARGVDSQLRTRFASPLQVLLVLTMIVLLVTCANVGAMVLVRGQVRRHEIVVRLAIGASVKRLFQQLFTESVLLASLAGLAGLLLGFWCSWSLIRLMSTAEAPISIHVPLDLVVVAFTVAISLLACVAFGVLPIFQAMRVNLTPALSQGAVDPITGRVRFSVGRLLVASQIALSVLFLIGAGLFVRSLTELSRVDLGFDPHKLLLFSMNPSPSQGNASGSLNDLYLLLLDKLQAEPGVRSATFSVGGPMAGGWGQKITDRDGVKVDVNVMQAAVGPQYFKTLAIPILQGRDFTVADDLKSPPVAVLSQSAARKLFGNSNPLGKSIGVAVSDDVGSSARADSAILQIVGVVQDTKFNGLRDLSPPVLYTSYLQRKLGGVTFELRTAGDPRSLERAVRQDMHSIDPVVPIFDTETMQDHLRDALRSQRALAIFSTAFSLLVLLLAALGIYGSLSYSVGQRIHEIGIRIALGAQQKDVQWLVIGQGARIVLIGVASGLLVSVGVTRLLKNFLYGVTANDPATFISAAVILTAVAAVACWIPARRAMRVDPMVALRYE
ncbi:MAG: ABC transporter permease [Candidatus Acidiferrales bacterium]